MSPVDFHRFHGSQPDVGDGRVEDLRVRLGEIVLLCAPAAAFNEETVIVSAVHWASLEVVL